VFLGQIWNHFISVHVTEVNILGHPEYNPHGAHFYIYDPALFNISTAAYVDVIRIMDSIQALHVDGSKNAFKVVFVVGDQQTYDRMCSLVVMNPSRYRWCIPLNGDFHFVAHTVAAFHDLFYLPFSAFIVRKIGFEKVIKEDDDNITNFKQYDHFYMLLTLAIITLLCELFDPAALAQPELLISNLKPNKGKSVCYILVCSE